MSDLTNQINELFDGPQEPKQEPVVEEIVEQVEQPKKKHVYKRLERPSMKRKSKTTPALNESVAQKNFNIKNSIDDLFAAADRSEVQEMKDALLPKRGPTSER